MSIMQMNFNPSSYRVQTVLSATNKKINMATLHLATGKKINDPSEGAAESGIHSRMAAKK